MILLAVTAVLAVIATHLWLLSPAHFFPVVVAVGILCSRPTFVGERYPWLGPVILMACALVALIQGGNSRRVPFWPTALILLTGAWGIIHETIVPGSEPNLGTTALTFLAPLVTFYFIARNRDQLAQVKNVLVGAISAAAVLTTTSFLAGLVIGWGPLHIGAVPLGYEQFSAGYLLPGSLIYGADVVGSIPRFLGLGREPGMGAILIGWAFFAMPKSWRGQLALKVALLVALAATQSTTGIGLFGLAWAIYGVFGQRRFNPFVALAGLAAGGYVTWTAIVNPAFGFLSKVQSTGTSFIDRNRATLAGVEAFVEQPFTATTDVPLSSVNLIASAAVTGAPWVILMFLLLLAPVLRAIRTDRRNPALYSSGLILVSMVGSQPLAGSTAVLALVLINYYGIDRFAALDREPVHDASSLTVSAPSELPSPAHVRADPPARKPTAIRSRPSSLRYRQGSARAWN